MIDIIIESPFLPQRKIKLDENKWTIEKLTSVIAGKIKVLGKSIDKNLVKYRVEFDSGDMYDICRLNDYPLYLGSFRDKIVKLDNSFVDNTLTIKVSFQEEHFNRVRNSVKLLESDTLEHFIERSNKRNSLSNIQTITNIESDEFKSIELIRPKLKRYSRRYIDYKLSVNSKWKNLLEEMRRQKMIGLEDPNTVIRIESKDEPNIKNIEDEINKLEENSKKFKAKDKNAKSRCSCIKKLFKRKKKKDIVKSAFHYNFDDNSGESNNSNIKKEDIVSVESDLNYHDENVLDDDEIEGKMFYTWDDSDDFLLD